MWKHSGCIFHLIHFSINSALVVSNTKLSEQNECAIGMSGRLCTAPCRYPSYGKRCQSMCYCSKISCNAKTGCKDGMERSIYQTRKSTNAKQLDNVIVPTTGTEACPKGFTGSACEIKCRFPAYGALCQSACNCTKDQCNHISGCDVTERNAVTENLSQDSNSKKSYHGTTMQMPTFIEEAMNSSSSDKKKIFGNDNTIKFTECDPMLRITTQSTSTTHMSVFIRTS
uniref:Multiple epidermal growth factor-like domains protein 10 isoform X3 n=2 Tax=Crassostrea virginica TaxID=6565 RepID=A0A8B8ANK5_CRAVI|nr:multiple epidermal growth factor-like domains protein 10 isoform X3 [Crassostrea virginica]